ncbi:MAG: S41 family peptidase [Ferruginibacter sp.]
MLKPLVFIFLLLPFLPACTVTKNNAATHKYPRNSLQSDFLLLQNILEAKHPSLYWYTPKDSMDQYFAQYYAAIEDSMTELQFAWKILAPVVDKIHCGHTSLSMSKPYSRWAEGKRQPSFPLYFKVWNDTMAVTANLNRKDSIFNRGTLVTAINGVNNADMISHIFSFLPEDGHAENVNYMRLSGNFPYFHRNIYGLDSTYKVNYIDSAGNPAMAKVKAWFPPKDSLKKDSLAKIEKPKKPKVPKEKRLKRYRSLDYDSTGKIAVMTLNSFSNGQLRRFWRRSFREMREKKIENMILDLRLNGGGKVGLSTLLTRYISHQPFKVADTLTTNSRCLSPYTKYIKGHFLNNIELWFIAHKKSDGQYHLSHLEKKLYEPKKNNHYSGTVYVLTTGITFSASSLFCNAVKAQDNIIIAGEETGGGWYGNNGIMIPDVTLPHTGLRMRLPLFRLVQYKHVLFKGTGVLPDIFIPPNYPALLQNVDFKMKTVLQGIYAGVKIK